MKKCFVIFLSFFYLIVSSGFTINYHYCGGKLKKVSLISFDEKGCCGSKKKSKGCCHDKTSFVKIKDSHKANDFVKAPVNFPVLMKPESFLLFVILPTDNSNSVVSNYHAPPVLYDNPLYLKHRVFLI